MNKSFKEIALLLIALLPAAYCLIEYPSMPEEVPIHFNYKGEPDSWGSKSTYLWLTLLLSPALYFLFKVLPKIDPKKKIEEMGNKFVHLRFIFGIFFSSILIYIIMVAAGHTANNNSFILVLVCLLLAFIGNYLQTVRPNYLLGIRTPWTLHNEEVWRKTHILSGKLWMSGGLIMIPVIFLSSPLVYTTSFIIVVAIMVLVPLIYSYISYQKIRNSA